MKLYVLDLGKIVMVSDNPVVDSSEGGEPPAIPVHAFLIDSPEGKVLFDAGCNPHGMDGEWPPAMRVNPYVCPADSTLIARLDQIGLKPEDVDILVMSHLHLDHAGCIYQFPEAKVYVQAEELRKTYEDYENGCPDIFHVPCDTEKWKTMGTKWVPVEGDPEVPLFPGVTILDLKAGHSFGMLGLLVELKDRNYLLVADAAYSAEHYGPPAQFSGAVVDAEGYMAAMELIRSYEKKYDATVLFGHDMEQFLSLTKSQDGYYE